MTPPPNPNSEQAPGAVGNPVWTRVPTLERALPGLFAAFSGAMPRAPDAELAVHLRDGVQALGGQAASIPLLLMQRHTADIAHLGVSGSADGIQPRQRQQSIAGGPQTAALAEALLGPPDRPLDGAASALGGAGGLVGVKTADCVPVLAVDLVQGRYAALHAGWRGVALGILPNLLAHWLAAGSRAGDLRLVLGPHIHGCCYEVGEDCLEQFTPQERLAGEQPRGSARHLELSAVLGVQAARNGLVSEQIEVSPHCTFCYRAPDGTHPYASYRRALSAGGTLSATNVSLIGPLQTRPPQIRPLQTG